MADLNTSPNLTDPDGLYRILIDLHAGCTDEESHKRSAKLILCLANHIGDEHIFRQAVAIAGDVRIPTKDT